MVKPNIFGGEKERKIVVFFVGVFDAISFSLFVANFGGKKRALFGSEKWRIWRRYFDGEFGGKFGALFSRLGMRHGIKKIGLGFSV